MSGESEISKLANRLLELSAEELEQFGKSGGLIEKMIDLKRAIEDAEERSSEAEEKQAAQVFRELRGYLEDGEVELSGPECVLLGSYYLHEEGNEMLESKRLNIFLDSYGRKPSNSTSIVDKLGARGAVSIDADGLHSHKKFRLTGQGREEALELVGRLRRGGGGKFAVVG